MTVAVRRDNVVSISTIGIPQCINNIYVTEYGLFFAQAIDIRSKIS